MNPLRNIFPLAVFVVFLAATLLIRNSGPHAQMESLRGDAETRPTRTARTESDFAAIRVLLRDGKIGEAREMLRQLAAEDPVEFFRLIDNFPGLPGLEDIVSEAAGRLPWNQPKITDLLNRITNSGLRDLAWKSYINPHVGILPDEEIFAVGSKAREFRFLSALSGLFKDAAEKRPYEFLKFLNTIDGTFLRVAFFQELMKFHPGRASELFNSIPDGAGGSAYDKSYILQARVVALPTAENLHAVLLERGSRGVFDGDSGSFLVGSAYPQATPEEKSRILGMIQSQPPLARNRLLEGIVFSTAFSYNDPIAPAEFSQILGLYTSGHLQEEALERWLKRNKDLDQNDPEWIDHLPTERLRNYALDLRAEPESGPGS